MNAAPHDWNSASQTHGAQETRRVAQFGREAKNEKPLILCLLMCIVCLEAIFKATRVTEAFQCCAAAWRATLLRQIVGQTGQPAVFRPAALTVAVGGNRTWRSLNVAYATGRHDDGCQMETVPLDRKD